MTVCLLMCLASCSYDKDPIRSLPSYHAKHLFTSGKFQDYTDFGMYYYKNLNDKVLADSTYFQKTDTETIALVKSYVTHFEDSAIWLGDDKDIRTLRANYNFDKSMIRAGNWYCLESKESFTPFDNYTLYYVDMDSQILYYFHFNI